MTATIRLDFSVRAACPIQGVSVGTPGDSSTVRIDFLPEATPEQRAAAQAVVDGFDWADAAQAAWELTQTRARALVTLLTRSDDTGIQVRAVLDAVCTLANNEFEALGRGRPLVAANLLAYLSQHPTAGDPQ